MGTSILHIMSEMYRVNYIPHINIKNKSSTETSRNCGESSCAANFFKYLTVNIGAREWVVIQY